MNNAVILVVDDSASIRMQVRLLLEKENFTVRLAGNQLGMMNAIEEYGEIADLIIMDLNLKGEQGFDLIKVLRENSKYKDIPVLVLTEYAEKESVLTAKKIGVKGYLRKPIVREDMIEKIADIIKQIKS